MITTHRPALAQTMRMLALHGVSHEAWDRYTDQGDWHYDVLAHGFKYNLSDIQAALGIHQLRKLDQFIERRAMIRRGCTTTRSAAWKRWRLPPDNPRCRHAWHLYILRLNLRQAQDRPREDYPRTAAKRHRHERALHPDSVASLFFTAAAGAVCLSARARTVSADCLVAVVSGDDRGPGPLCGPECPGGRGKFETREISGDGRADRDTPCRRI